MPAFTREDVRRCIELLEGLVHDREALAALAEDDRLALLVAAGRLSRPTRHEKQRMVKVFRRVERKQGQAHDREARAQTAIREARRSEVFTPPPELPAAAATAEAEAPPARELRQARACYVCKAEYRRLHFFYDAMCPSCADLNYRKRFQWAPLDGRVALITGARVKIGFQAALKMLRAGAHVIVTTRFPRDAAQRFAREEDFARWRERLEVHGLDLRHSPSVELFARYLDRTKGRLDILINNAAQTVRRPPGFYAHLLENEGRSLSDLPRDEARVLAAHEAHKGALGAHLLGEREGAALGGGADLLPWNAAGPAMGIRASSLLSQIPYAYDDGATADLFPAGRADADLQQVDLRRVNSWRLALHEVPPAEMLEVHLVNAVAPFILASKLKPLMLRHPSNDKHIVNVSAMEGVFARRTKTDKHPHTNMAKAALNMMTLTAAPGYAADGIFMNAVDTGWITDEDPAHHAARKQRDHDFQPPLDIVDGAARICDPFFSGLLTGLHLSGKFLKDYAPSPW